LYLLLGEVKRVSYKNKDEEGSDESNISA